MTTLSPNAAPTTGPTNDERLTALNRWLGQFESKYQLRLESIRPASNDASFRRYFRIDAAGGESFIAMDAPPAQENCAPFVHAARVMGTANVSVPTVIEQSLEQGFLLLSDFGSTTYLRVLAPDTAHALYLDAIEALITFQKNCPTDSLASYDDALLRRELSLYPDWYVSRHKQLKLSELDQAVMQAAFDTLVTNNLAQPAVWVHRDYHSRNLMLLAGKANPGILDFQDAVKGPITYDLVSLLRDAYVSWDEEMVIDWCARYWERARGVGLPVAADFSDFYQDFEWMGLQRHLKVLGIFARLNYRDGKGQYLSDMPLVLEYVRKAAGRYRAFDRFAAVLDKIEDTGVRVGYTF
jgi:N-acetylmuramate 1-kinase